MQQEILISIGHCSTLKTGVWNWNYDLDKYEHKLAANENQIWYFKCDSKSWIESWIDTKMEFQRNIQK